MGLFSHVSSRFTHIYGNFATGIFVLRPSISVQVSKKIFGIRNKRWRGPNKHEKGEGLEKILKLQALRDVYLALKINYQE